MKKKSIVVLLSSLLISTSLMTMESAQAETVQERSLTKMPNVNSSLKAKESVMKLPKNLKVKKNLDQFVVTKQEKDHKGFTHYTLKPKVNGVEAYGSEIKVHTDNKGEVVHVNGDLDQDRIVPTNKVTLSKDQAIAKAFASIGLKQNEVKNFRGFDIVEKVDVSIHPDKNKYMYDIRIIYVQPEVATWDIQLDAQTGEIIKKQNRANSIGYGDSAIPGTGTPMMGRGLSVKGSYRPIDIFKSDVDGNYHLSNQANKTLLETYTLHNTNMQQWTVMNSPSRIFRSKNLAPAVDAHYFANETYKYYRDVHGRESYDGYGAPLYSMVHFQYNLNNAYWNGQAMVYGDGDGYTFGPLSQANDIVAHELTHAVTFNTANLEYANQPGALNEMFSDVMAYFIDPDWLMGEDAYTPGTPGDALRSFENPELYDQPSHMNDFVVLPNTEQGDYGGVHINSGIPNKAFYNLIAIEGMSPEKAQHIYYRTLTVYLTQFSNFADCKAALIRSAQDLYSDAEAQQVKRAFDAVGI